MSRARRVPLLLFAGALAVGCARVDDIPLGALERDAGGGRIANEPPPDRDSGRPSPPVQIEAGPEPLPPDDEPEEDELDASALPDAAIQEDAGPRDAGALDARTNAGSDASLDAGDGGTREPGDAASDGATSDAARSLLCTFEPWHCL